MIVYDPSMKNTPPGWLHIDECLRIGKRPKELGFAESLSTGDLNRVISRYRLCKSFNCVCLDGYTKETERGYTALFRLFLTWSAFECFLSAMNLKRDNCQSILLKHHPGDLASRIRSLDRRKVFYEFIRSKLNTEKQKEELEDAYNGRTKNITILASSIRHIFAHGPLTPNVKGAYPTDVIQICDELSEFLLNVMDSEFSAISAKIHAT